MTKLILHIGSHKTATTSIQKFLMDRKKELLDKEIRLFDIDPDLSINEYGHNNHWVIHEGVGKNFYGKFNLNWLKILSDLESKYETVIFSAEHLSWIFDRAEIERIYDALSEMFDSIKIIVYIRRQDLQLLSHHQQGSKHFNWCEQKYYGDEARAFPTNDEYEEYLDYYSRLSMWGDIFGDDSLIVRPFEIEQLRNNDVIDDFLHYTNIPLAPSVVRVNESNDSSKTILGHLYNQLGISHLDTKRIITLNNITGNKKLLGSKSNALNIYEKYKLSNKYLNARYNVSNKEFIFNENFELYPDLENDLLIELYENIVKQLLTFIDQKTAFISDKDYYVLRDQLLLLNKTSPELTEPVIEIVSKLRKNPIKLKNILKISKQKK